MNLGVVFVDGDCLDVEAGSPNDVEVFCLDVGGFDELPVNRTAVAEDVPTRGRFRGRNHAGGVVRRADDDEYGADGDVAERFTDAGEWEDVPPGLFFAFFVFDCEGFLGEAISGNDEAVAETTAAVAESEELKVLFLFDEGESDGKASDD